MRKDCAAFLTEAGSLISESTCLRNGRDLGDGGVYSAHQLAGHDFWLTRCGHGVGFWEYDRWQTEAGEALTKLARAAGNVDIYLGDDGQIYQM